MKVSFLGTLNAIGEVLETFINKIALIILTVLTTAILLLTWSSNHYIKELMVMNLKKEKEVKNELVLTYEKILSLNVRSQGYKERMQVNINELKAHLIKLQTLAISNQLFRNVTTDDKKIINDTALKEIDALLDEVDLIHNDLIQLNAILTETINANNANNAN